MCGPRRCFSSHLLPPHLHGGDVVEKKKRADSGGFKPRLLGNETIDGAKEGAERQEMTGRAGGERISS